MGIAEEHPQHSGAATDSALREPRASAFDDVRAEDHRRQFTDRLKADPGEVGLEAVEMVAVSMDRGGAQPALFDQVVEEARNDVDEGLRVRAPTGRLEAGEHDREQLLDRTSHLLRHRPRRARPSVVLGDSLGHEGLDVRRQLGDRLRPA
jgi:hypothetical protein